MLPSRQSFLSAGDDLVEAAAGSQLQAADTGDTGSDLEAPGSEVCSSRVMMLSSCGWTSL